MTADGISLRDVEPADRDWLLALNQACLPAVSSLTWESLGQLLDRAAVTRLASADGAPVGALIAFRPGTDYGSDNYVWFSDRFDDFLYVDRVMVTDAARGRGVGRALYDDLVAVARRLGVPRLTCEVNEAPPNPGSMRFHAQYGFRTIESRPSAGGSKRVAMLAWPVPA